MTNCDMTLLNALNVGGRDFNRQIDFFRQASTFCAGQRYGLDAFHPGKFDRFDHIFRTTAGTYADQYVSRSSESFDLPHENQVEFIIIPDCSKQGSIGGQRQSRDRWSFQFKPRNQFGRQMLGVCGTAAIAAEQNLAASLITID